MNASILDELVNKGILLRSENRECVDVERV